MQSSNGFQSRLGRFFLAGSLGIAVLAPAALGQSAPPPQPSIEQLNRAFAILQQDDDKIPADNYDPVAVVKAVEGRPDDLFAWVRDKTRWVPYRGALRGPIGVLVDRSGNSLDRSLLLAEFYRHTPSHFRIAHATLSAEQAKGLFEKLRVAPKVPPIPFESHEGTGPSSIAAAQRLERLGESMTQRAAAASTSLSTALGAQGQIANSDDASLAALSDHWWLQRQDEGKWIDLDVTIPGAKPGDSVCPPAETLEFDKLSKDVWQTLRIAVIAERWENGKLIETTVLSRVVKPGAVVGSTIYLSHIPLQWATIPPTGSTPDAAKAAREQALKPTEWVPMLMLGMESANEAGIQADGTIDPKPQLDSLASAGASVVKGANAALDALDVGTPATPTIAAPKGVFTAEWVEYTLRGPGISDQKVRREVFDLVGPAARAAGVSARPEPDELARANAALALRGRIDIAALPCQISPAFVNHLLLRWVIDAKPDVMKSLATLKQKKAGAKDEVTAPPPCPAALYGLALLRRLYSPTAADWFIARPNVFTYHSFARLTRDGGQIYTEATDLVTDEVAIEPWSKVDAVKLRLDQGVLDTAAEGSLLPAGSERSSASDTLAAAASQSSEWIVARTVADLSRVRATPDDLARLKAEVAAGRVVVLPSAPIHIGTRDTLAWWLMDPATGTTLGIGERGWGPEMAERTVLQNITLWIMENKRWVCLAAGVTTVANVCSSLFNLSELGGDALNVIQGALDTACGV